MNMLEQEINKQYLSRLERMLKDEFGLEILEKYEEIELGVNFRPDALIVTKIGRYQVPMAIEIKSAVNHQSQVQRLTEFAAKFEGIVIVVSSSIDDKIKEKLKEHGVGFYEIDKAIFLPLDFQLRADGQALSEQNFLINKTGFRAESNVKLMLYFVANPASLEFTQRQLASDLDISLGAINKALKNLETVGVVKTSKNKRYLGNLEDIINRWRISLLDFERESLSIGRFSPSSERFYSEWPNKDLKSVGAYWGGEPAASIRTKYLSPGHFTIYSYNERPSEVAKLLRLRSDTKGNIEIYRCFWPDSLNNEDGTIPDFVTYCELLNSRIDRNIETARLLREKIETELAKYEF